MPYLLIKDWHTILISVTTITEIKGESFFGTLYQQKVIGCLQIILVVLVYKHCAVLIIFPAFGKDIYNFNQDH